MEKNKIPKDSFDLQYTDLVKDPVESVKRAYKHFGIKTEAVFEKRMRIWLKDNRQHKHGTPMYSPETFGLRPEEIREGFKVYQERFNITTET